MVHNPHVQGNLPKTYFPTYWLSDGSARSAMIVVANAVLMFVNTMRMFCCAMLVLVNAMRVFVVLC